MTPAIKQTLDSIVNTSIKISEVRKSIKGLQKETQELCLTLKLKKKGQILHSFGDKNYVFTFDEDGEIVSLLELHSLNELLEEPEAGSK